MTAIEKLDYGGWYGSLAISFAKRPEKTIISSLKHEGPLRVQRPFYPESDVCHVYLLHPPGGVVGGDSLNISVCLDNSSHALLTTPGSTKFYRSAGDVAYLTQNLLAKKDSMLEWFPQENILFPGAKVKQRTEIHLEDNANFIGWEINCLGRPVNKERFDSGEFDAALHVFRDKKPMLFERQRVFEQRQLRATAGLRSYPMNAIFLCTSCDEKHISLARDVVEKLSPAFPVGITLLDDMLVLRALGHQTEPLQKIMIAVWQTLRPIIINKEAVLPRIWST